MLLRKNPNKKYIEQYTLERFLACAEELPFVTDIIQSETPDFILHTENAKISVELTRLIRPDLMEPENFERRVVQMGWDMFKAKHDVELYVLIDFSRLPKNCRPAEVNELAEMIFTLAEEAYLKNPEGPFKVSLRGKRKHFNQYIDSMTISNQMGMDNWQPFGAFKVDHIDPVWLQQKVTTKEKNMRRYTETFDENWLLLACNFGFKSSTFTFYPFVPINITSAFSRVYVYKYMDNTCLRLQ